MKNEKCKNRGEGEGDEPQEVRRKWKNTSEERRWDGNLNGKNPFRT